MAATPSSVDVVCFGVGGGTGSTTLSGTVVGDVKAWILQALIDGVPWDLTGATVTLTLQPPGGASALVRTAAVSGSPGIATYANVTADLSVSGLWSRWWIVTQGGLKETSKPIGFYVSAAGQTF